MIIVMSTAVIQAGAEITTPINSSLEICAAHVAEVIEKEKMIPVMMALEEMAKAILAKMMQVKMTTQVMKVMLVYVLTLTS